MTSLFEHGGITFGLAAERVGCGIFAPRIRLNFNDTSNSPVRPNKQLVQEFWSHKSRMAQVKRSGKTLHELLVKATAFDDFFQLLQGVSLIGGNYLIQQLIRCFLEQVRKCIAIDHHLWNLLFEPFKRFVELLK